VKSVDDRATEYLDMFRNEQYLELTSFLQVESAETIVAFCRLVAKYENVTHLEFIRRLLSE
jgi:hypothetical protein